VLAWLERQDAEEVFTSAITLAEIEAGLVGMPEGRRKAEKRVAAERVLGLFEGRILAFDTTAARSYGALFGRVGIAGSRSRAFDFQIAAIARVHGMAVATRNVRDFEDCGVAVIDPWAPA
jgi:predicted nucleic acid-binding protein